MCVGLGHPGMRRWWVSIFLGLLACRRPRPWHSFEFASYPPPLTGEDLVIVMAHSGTKHYSGEALAMAKASGASTALVTCQTTEARVDQADVVVRTTYRDRSSAFTISHTGAMTALAMIAARVKGGEGSGRELEGLPDAVASALGTEEEVKEIVGRVRLLRVVLLCGLGAKCFYGIRGGVEDKRGSLRRDDGLSA